MLLTLNNLLNFTLPNPEGVTNNISKLGSLQRTTLLKTSLDVFHSMQFVQEQPYSVDDTDDVEVEYVTEGLSPLDPNYRAFAKIFEAFKVLVSGFFVYDIKLR